MLCNTFFRYVITPALTFLPDGASHRYPVCALGCWT